MANEQGAAPLSERAGEFFMEAVTLTTEILSARMHPVIGSSDAAYTYGTTHTRKGLTK